MYKRQPPRSSRRYGHPTSPPVTHVHALHTSRYFKLLLKATWTPDERVPKFQYKDASGTLMMLPSDLVLIEDKDFKPYVELYGERERGSKV